MKKLKISELIMVPFQKTKNLTRLVLIFLMLFAFEAEAQNNGLNFNGYNNTNPDGLQNKVTCGNSIGNFGTSDFTIEFYIKTTAADNNAQFLLTKRSVCGHASFFNIGITNGFVYLEIDQDNNGTNHNDLASTTAVNDGTWHHVALVRSGTILTFYIDGAVSGSETNSFITNVNNSDNLTIGGFGSNCSTNQNFVGSLDELRIWNVARTQSQIQNNMTNELTGNETGLITYFNFNQGTANGYNTGVTTLNDLTSNQNNGTLSNFALAGTTSNWVSVIKTTVAGIVSANQTITSPTGTGVTTVIGDKSLNSGDWIPVRPSMSWGDMPWEQIPADNVAQSFKASISASWTGLKINVKNINQPGDFTLKIFSGNGVYGSTILSQTFSIYNNGFNNFTFSSPIALTAGQFYTFQLSSNGYADIYIDGSGSSLPFGTFYQNGNGVGGALYFENTYQINNANWNNLTLTGNNGDVLYWQKSADASFSNPITIASTSSTLYSSSIGNLSATTYFRAIVKYGGDAAANTNTVKITVSINTNNTTQVQTRQCGSMVTPYQWIFAYAVTGATSYRFNIYDDNGLVTSIDRSVPYFRFYGNTFTYGATYQVKIQVKQNGVYGNEGDACSVALENLPTIKLKDAYCGITVNPYQWMFSNAVTGATSYRFNIYNGSTLVTIIDRTVPYFRFQGNTFAYGATYQVKIQVEQNGVYGNEGDACSVTLESLPTIKLKDAYCGITVNPYQWMFANTVTGATSYRFNVYQGSTLVTSIDRAVPYFRFYGNSFTYGATYQVKIQLEQNGVYGIEGKSCDITIQANGTTREVVDTEVKDVIDTSHSVLSAYPNPFTASFTITPLEGETATMFYQVYDVTGKMLESKSVEASEITNHTIGADYPVGMYLIIARQSATTQTFKMIKQ